METLDEHNRNVEKGIKSPYGYARVLCPKCNKQMKFAGNIHSRLVECPHCKHTGIKD